MKKLLSTIFLLSFAAAKAGQSIPLDQNQTYKCHIYSDDQMSTQVFDYDKFTGWQSCKDRAQQYPDPRPWVFVGKNDHKIYCGTCGYDPACGGDCILN